MVKTCVICGGTFTAAPSAKVVTCSPVCRAERARRAARVVGRHWAAAKKHKLCGVMTNNLRKGMPAARCSPVAGPFATNHSAKWWRLRSPAGMVYQVHNLQLFCRQQFEENWRRAAAGLRQVIRWQEGKTKRTVSVYKGWGIARGENLTTPK